VIKFWPSRVPGKGVCGGAKFLALPYYSQHAVFASPPRAFFISLVVYFEWRFIDTMSQCNCARRAWLYCAGFVAALRAVHAARFVGDRIKPTSRTDKNFCRHPVGDTSADCRLTLLTFLVVEKNFCRADRSLRFRRWQIGSREQSGARMRDWVHVFSFSFSHHVFIL